MAKIGSITDKAKEQAKKRKPGTTIDSLLGGKKHGSGLLSGGKKQSSGLLSGKKQDSGLLSGGAQTQPNDAYQAAIAKLMGGINNGITTGLNQIPKPNIYTPQPMGHTQPQGINQPGGMPNYAEMLANRSLGGGQTQGIQLPGTQNLQGIVPAAQTGGSADYVRRVLGMSSNINQPQQPANRMQTIQAQGITGPSMQTISNNYAGNVAGNGKQPEKEKPVTPIAGAPAGNTAPMYNGPLPEEVRKQQNAAESSSAMQDYIRRYGQNINANNDQRIAPLETNRNDNRLNAAAWNPMDVSIRNRFEQKEANGLGVPKGMLPAVRQGYGEQMRAAQEWDEKIRNTSILDYRNYFDIMGEGVRMGAFDGDENSDTNALKSDDKLREEIEILSQQLLTTADEDEQADIKNEIALKRNLLGFRNMLKDPSQIRQFDVDALPNRSPVTSKYDSNYMQVHGDPVDVAYYYANVPYDIIYQEAKGVGYKILQDDDGNLYTNNPRPDKIPENLHPSDKRASKYMFMTKDERDIFNTLYLNGERGKADYYLSLISSSLEERKAAYNDNAARWMVNNGVLGKLEGLGTVFTNPVASLLGSIQALGAELGIEGSGDKYSPLMSGLKHNESIRDEVGKNWDAWTEKHGFKGLGRFLSGVSFSIADNVLALLIGKAAGSLTAETSAQALRNSTTFVQIVMSTEATGNKFIQQLNAGVDPTLAATRAFASGVVEAITEKYSIEHYLNASNKDKFLQYMVKSFIAEGSEEVASDWLYAVSDEILSRFLNQQSEMAVQYEQLKAEYGEDEAFRMLFSDFLNQNIESFLAGGISGLGMGGAGYAMNAIGTGRTVIRQENSTQNIDAMLRAVETQDAGAEAKKLASDIRKNLDNNRQPNMAKLGRLTQMLMENSNEEIRNTYESAYTEVINDELANRGLNEKQISKIGPIVTKALLQDISSLTRSERNALHQNDTAASLMLELTEGIAQENKTLRQAEELAQERSKGARQINMAAEKALTGTVNMTDSIVQDARKKAQRIAEEAAESAVTGPRTGSNVEVQVDDGYADIVDFVTVEEKTKNKNGKEVTKMVPKIRVMVDGNPVAKNLAEVKATNPEVGAVIQMVRDNPRIMGEAYLSEVIRNAQKLGTDNMNGRYAEDVMAINIAAKLGKRMPWVSIGSEMANNLYGMARAEMNDHDRAMEEEFKGKVQRTESGKGKLGFDGTVYGTEEFNQKIDGLHLKQQQKHEISILGAFAKKAGLNNIELIYDPENTDDFGYFEHETGKVKINIAGMDSKQNGVAHSMLITAGHEFTHMLQALSAKAYGNARKTVLDMFEDKGANIENMVMDKINSYSKYGVMLSVEDAIDEIVADSYDQVLLSEKFANNLKETDIEAYGKVRKFVARLIGTLKRIVNIARGSASTESWSLYLNGKLEKMAKVWLDEYENAMPAQTEKDAFKPTEQYTAEQVEDARDIVQEAATHPVTQFSVNTNNRGVQVQVIKNGLMAVHNLSERSFVSVLEMLGFPMPSIAVIGNQAWTGYGNISVFFGKNAVRFAEGSVYNGDAMTPTLGNNRVRNTNEAMDVLHQQPARGSRGTSDMVQLFTDYKEAANIDEARRKAYQTTEERQQIKEQADALQSEIFDAAKRIGSEKYGSDLNNRQLTQSVGMGVLTAAEIMQREQDLTHEDRMQILQDNMDLMLEHAQGVDLTAEDFTTEQYEQMLEFIDVASQLSSGWRMMESKPDAVMDFKNDLKAVLMPDDTPNKVIQQALDAGIAKEKIFFYPHNNFKARQAAMMELPNVAEGVRFSKRMQDNEQNMTVEQKQIDNDYAQAVDEGNVSKQNDLVKETAKRNGFYTDEFAYHGTDSFGFTEFDMSKSQNEIFVAFSPKVARTYTGTGDVQNIGKNYAKMGLENMNVKGIEKELNDFFKVNNKESGKPYNISNVEGYSRDEYLDEIKKEFEDIKKEAKGTEFEEQLSNLLDRIAKTDKSTDKNDMRAMRNELDQIRKKADGEIYDMLGDLSIFKLPALFAAEDTFRLEAEGRNSKHYNTYYLSRTQAVNQLLGSTDDAGVYKFYTRPGKQLVIDAHGSNWNRIAVPFDESKFYSTREISKWAKENGYDSVRINNVEDHGGRQFYDDGAGNGDIGIFFNQGDVKSADPITYDDQGNVIPPSQRFNTENNDIRYSIKNTYNMKWDDQVSKFISNKLGKHDVLTVTKKDEMTDYGIKEPITMAQSVMRKGMRLVDPGKSRSAHNIEEEKVRLLREGIKDPLAKIETNRGKILITDLLHDGKNIIAAGRHMDQYIKGGTLDIKSFYYRNDMTTLFGKYENGHFAADETVKITLYKNSATEVLSKGSKQYGAGAEVLDAIKRLSQNSGESNIKKSLRQMTPFEKGYMEAVEKGDMKAAQDYVDDVAAENGYTIHAYHGTGRADRVGNVFLPERATSGPMAFFTDDRSVAEGYARNKRDTSIEYDEEYGDYSTQFRYKTKDGKTIPVGDLWKKLDFASRQKITEAAKHIVLDDEGENIIWDENAQHGVGNFTDYERKLHGWNSIETLIEGWLNGGTLFGREGDFKKVLEMAGIKDVIWNNPDAREEKVYDTYLKIQNPFNTSEMYTDEFVDGLMEWWEEQDQSKYTKESMEADAWDKNSRSVEEWADLARMDIKNGNTHAWTSIPDAVTDYIKSLGYDGIQDEGGKGGGIGHTVWIPFSSEQIKSAEPVTYNDNGEVISPIDRFNSKNPDIRYSMRQLDENYAQVVARKDMDAAQRMVDEAAENAGYVKEAYHGTLNGGFTIFDKKKAHIGGNSGAGFYFSSNQDDSEANYSDVEGADNHFKVMHLVEKIQQYIEDTGENEYAGIPIPEDATDEELEDIAKKMIQGNPQTYHVRLNPGRVYIRDYGKSTNLLENVYDDFDESDYNRDDFDSDEQYEDAVFEGREEHLYQAISDAVYEAIRDVDSNFEIVSPVDYESIISELAMHAQDYDELTWKDVSKVISEQYIDALVDDGEESADASAEITRAIVEAFGFDSIEDREVGTKFNQLKNMSARDTVHYIMFRPNQIKSTDPVTYDRNGDPIPLSQRFNQGNNDIRYSKRIAEQDVRQSRRTPDMDVNNWMESLQPWQLRTESERQLLQDYKDLRMKIQLQNKRISDYQDRLHRLEAKDPATLTQQEKRQMEGLKIRIQNAQNTRDELEEKLINITSDEGYAKIMMQQSKFVDDFLAGRTQDEVTEAVKRMQDTAGKMLQRANQSAEALKKIAEDAGVRDIRERNKANPQKMAAEIRKEYGSTINKQELADGLLAIQLKIQNGTDPEQVMADVETLAGKVLEGIKGEKSEYLGMLRGTTITLGPGQLKELHGSRRNMRDVRSILAGTGIKVKLATAEQIRDKKVTTLDSIWDELCDMVPLLNRDAYEKEQLFELMRVVQNEKKNSSGAQQYSEMLPEVMDDIMNRAMGQNLDKNMDPAVQKELEKIHKYVEGLTGKATELAEVIGTMQDMLGDVVKAGQQAATWTDAMKRDVANTIEYFDRTAKLAQDTARNEHLRQVIANLKSEAAQKLLKTNQEWRDLIERDRKARLQAEDNEVTKNKMNTVVTRLYNLLAGETDTKNIPEEYKGLARELIGMFYDNDVDGRRLLKKYDKKRRDRMGELLKIWKQQEGEFDLSEFTGQEATEAMREVGWKIMDDLNVIREMMEEWNGKYNGKNKLETLEQMGRTLKTMQEAVSEIYNIIQKARELDIEGRKVQIEDAAEAFIEDAKRSNFKGDRPNTKIGRAMTDVERLVKTGNVTPPYFIKNLKNAAMDMIWKGFKGGENRSGLQYRQAKLFMDETAKKFNYDTWDQKKRTAIPTMTGKVNMTVEQMMSLYATWKREQTIGPDNSEHLKKGGFFLEEEDDRIMRREMKRLKPHRVIDDTITALNNALTEEQKNYVDEVVRYMSEDMSKIGNEASMRMYGIKKYKEKYYYPFNRWQGIANFSSDKGSMIANQDNRAAHKGWTKRRVNNANNTLEIGNFTDVATAHIVEMINYNTMAVAIENMNKVLNYQTSEGDPSGLTKRNVRMIMRERYGSEALKYLETLMDDMNRGTVQDPRGTVFDKLLSGFRKGAVAGSMSVAAQQPLSYIRAAMEINPIYLARALSPDMWKGSYKEMIEHSGVAVIKEMGRFDMGFGASAKEYIRPKGKQSVAKTLAEKAGDWTTKLPEVMDRMTWTRMWSAVKLEQKHLHPEMDVKSDEFLDMVAERFNDVMRNTQVYDSVLVKSSNMRSKDKFVKSATSFMAEPTVSLNILMDAAKNFRKKGGMKYAAMAGATFLLGAIAQAAAKGIYGAGRNPDDDKTLKENFMYRMGANLLSEANPLGLISGYSDLIELLSKGEISNDAMTPIGKLAGIAKTIAKVKPDELGWRFWEDTVGQVAQLFGRVPAKNIMRDVRAMINWFDEAGAPVDFVGGTHYADRPTSSAVMKYQFIDSAMGNDLVGLINGLMGDAGYKTSNEAYYDRIYEAKTAGDADKAGEMTEYLLLGKGVKEKTLNSAIAKRARADESMSNMDKAEIVGEYGGRTSDIIKDAAEAGEISTAEAVGMMDLQDPSDYVKDQLRAGSIDAAEARKLLKEQDPQKDDDSIWWTVDRIEYKKETGNDAGGGKYYRLWDAMDGNSANDIGNAIQTMQAHGVQAKSIKGQINDHYKELYLAADASGKVKIRDAMQKAYKQLGMTAGDADKVINKWK